MALMETVPANNLGGIHFTIFMFIVSLPINFSRCQKICDEVFTSNLLIDIGITIVMHMPVAVRTCAVRAAAPHGMSEFLGDQDRMEQKKEIINK